MKTKNYILTVCCPKADDSRSIAASLNEKELQTLKTNIRKYTNYSVRFDCCLNVENAMPFSAVVEWLSNVKLFHTEYILSSVKVQVINLPEGILFLPSDCCLEVRVVEEFSKHTHDTCKKELELMSWVVNTFPTAKYGKYRNRFSLPSEREEFVGKSHTIKHVFSISKSGDLAIEITKRTYKKEITTL